MAGATRGLASPIRHFGLLWGVRMRRRVSAACCRRAGLCTAAADTRTGAPSDALRLWHRVWPARHGDPTAARSPAAAPVFDAFRERPTIALAISALRQEGDPDRAWAIFETVQAALYRDTEIVRFYQTMMSTCRRLSPSKAPLVLDAAVAAGVRVCDTLFCTFLGACQSVSPPLADEVLQRYPAHGPRSNNVIFGVAHICRLAGRPGSALFLVGDALDNNVELTRRLSSIFAACCAESGCADTAERLLDHGLRFQHQWCPQTYCNLIRALVAQNRFEYALQTLGRLDDADGMRPTVHMLSLVAIGLARAGRVEQALDLFKAMAGRPDCNVLDAVLITLITTSSRYSCVSALDFLHEYARDNALLDRPRIVSALASAYGRCPSRASALDSLHAIAQDHHYWKDSTAFCSFVSSFGRLSDLEAVRALHRFVLENNNSALGSDFLVRAFATAFGRCADVCSVDAVHEEATRNNYFGNAYVVSAFAFAYGRCSNLSRIETLHQFCRTHPSMNVDAVIAALTVAYAECGSILSAQQLFSGRCLASVPPVPVFNAMISAYALHGMLPRAVDVYDQIKEAGLVPTEAPLHALLAACANAGNLARASVIVAEFADKWNIRPNSTWQASNLSDPDCKPIDLATSESVAQPLSNPDAGRHAWRTSVQLSDRSLHFVCDDTCLRSDLALQECHGDLAERLREDWPHDAADQFGAKQSEVIAVAYAHMTVPVGDVVRLTKNTILAADRHAIVKRASAVLRRDIHLRDLQRYHFFQDGHCSCGE